MMIHEHSKLTDLEKKENFSFTLDAEAQFFHSSDLNKKRMMNMMKKKLTTILTLKIMKKNNGCLTSYIYLIPKALCVSFIALSFL